MSEILSWDQSAFREINSGLANPVLDPIIVFFRTPMNWIPLYVFLCVFLISNFKWKGLYIIISVVVAVALGDQISSHIIKPYMHRLRPCMDANMIGQVRLLVGCGGPYSFPSSHAVNHFIMAVFMISVLPRQMKWVKPFFLIWASLVAIAQVYVGVHYPLDIIFGAILGTLIGLFMATLCKMVFKIDLNKLVDE